MRPVYKWVAVGCLTLLPALPLTATAQEKIDPKLADSWAFMQKAMPGVPYAVLKAACQEGTVMVYYGTWITAQEAENAGFHKRFPCVNVQGYSAKTGERHERWMAEMNAGRYIADIIQETNPGVLNQERQKGLLTQYKISNADKIPKAAQNPGYWYGLRIAMVGIAWNTDRVSDKDAKVLQSWKGLLDPRWKKRAGVISPRAGGVGFLPWYLWPKLYGDGFLKKIGEQDPRVFGGTNPASAALASGDIAVLFNASETGLLPLYNKGAPIKWSLPDPGIGPVTGQAISAHAPHLAAAKLYQEYTFTSEGYKLWQKRGGAPARKDYKDQRKVAQESWYHLPSDLAEYSTADAAKRVHEVTAKFDKLIAKQK